MAFVDGTLMLANRSFIIENLFRCCDGRNELFQVGSKGGNDGDLEEDESFNALLKPYTSSSS